MLLMMLMMTINSIIVIYFVTRLMKKITRSSQPVLRNLLPNLSNHRKYNFHQMFRKINAQCVDVEDPLKNEWFWRISMSFNTSISMVAQLILNTFRFVSYCNIITFLCSLHIYMNSLISINFKRYVILFFWKIRIPYCGTFNTLDLTLLYFIPLDLFPLDLIPLELIPVCRSDLISLGAIPVSRCPKPVLYFF